MSETDMIVMVVAPGRTVITGNGRKIEHVQKMVRGVLTSVPVIVDVPGQTTFRSGEEVTLPRSEADRLARIGMLLPIDNGAIL